MFTISAWLTDFDFLDMTCEEKGLYFFLVLNIYENGGKYKIDERKLCKYANISPENYKKASDSISGKFKIKRGFIQHDKCTAVLKRTQTIRDKRVKAGKARWDTDSTCNASAEQVHKPKDASALQRQDKTRQVKKREEKASKQKESLLSVASDFSFIKRWLFDELGIIDRRECITFEGYSKKLFAHPAREQLLAGVTDLIADCKEQMKTGKIQRINMIRIVSSHLSKKLNGTKPG